MGFDTDDGLKPEALLEVAYRPTTERGVPATAALGRLIFAAERQQRAARYDHRASGQQRRAGPNVEGDEPDALRSR